MWRGWNRGPGLAGVLLVAVAVPLAQERVKLLYPQPLERPRLDTPVAGVHLGGQPRIYFRAPAPPAGAPGNWERIRGEQNVAFSRSWRQVVVYGRDGRDATWFQRPPAARVPPLPGKLRFAIDELGLTTVAFSDVPDPKGQYKVVSIGSPREVLVELTVTELLWVDVSDDGSRFALGTGSGVRVLERAGAPVLPDLPGTTESGRLSPQGTWLALTGIENGRPRLTWVGLRDPFRRSAFDVRVPGAVAFASAGDLAAHVAPQEVTVMRLDGGAPQEVQRRPPPAGFAWRDAAFDSQGRMALGRIRVERHPRRERGGAADPFRLGEARVAVDFFESPAGEPVASHEWTVQLWNNAAPELAFAEDGYLIANVWHSVYQVEPPWPH